MKMYILIKDSIPAASQFWRRLTLRWRAILDAALDDTLEE